MMLTTLLGLAATLAACDDDSGNAGQSDDPNAAPSPDAAVDLPDAMGSIEADMPEAWQALTPHLEAWFQGAPEASIVAVGRAWADRFDEGEALIEALTPFADALLALGMPSEAEALVATRIEADFAALEPVNIFGWQLAETEAQACALFDLIASA
ncbi:MAG: hypothetical protein ACE366_04900 [Bradymonadia bacterium]